MRVTLSSWVLDWRLGELLGVSNSRLQRTYKQHLHLLLRLEEFRDRTD